MPLVRPGPPATAAAPVSALRLPSEDAVRDMVAELLDRRVTVTRRIGAPSPADGEVASFLDDDGVLVAVAVADVPLVARAGAALALIPSGTSDAAVAEGVVPDALRENWYEVINILSSLLNGDASCHVKLAELHPTGPTLPADLAGVVGRDRVSHTFTVDIDGYGTGTLTFIAA